MLLTHQAMLPVKDHIRDLSKEFESLVTLDLSAHTTHHEPGLWLPSFRSSSFLSSSLPLFLPCFFLPSFLSSLFLSCPSLLPRFIPFSSSRLLLCEHGIPPPQPDVQTCNKNNSLCMPLNCERTLRPQKDASFLLTIEVFLLTVRLFYLRWGEP